MYIPFAKPDIGEREIDACVRVLKSGWLTSGEQCLLLEKRFSSFFSRPRVGMTTRQSESKVSLPHESHGAGDIESKLHAVSVNSATSGLHLVLEALAIGAGDEVIVPTFTFTASAEVVVHAGATPVFTDIEPNSLNISAQNIEKKITEQTRAIIVVHYAGLAADMDEILALASRKGLYVIEDAAHALPSKYKENYIGSLSSDATVFSFYVTKTMTSGEGGLILTRHRELAQRLRRLRLHGISRDTYLRSIENGDSKNERERQSWFYQVEEAGFKYNLSDINAAIAVEQFQRLEEMWLKRFKIAQKYYHALNVFPLNFFFQENQMRDHSWYLFTVSVEKIPDIKRENLIAELAKRGIQTSVHFIPLHRHPFWQQKFNLQEAVFPVADRIFPHILSLPIYSTMNGQMVDYVIQEVSSLLSR